jgi:hypothetical protein
MANKKEKNIIFSRKSQGHIEMILSFLIFVGFVFVLLFFIGPISEQKTSYSLLDRVQERIINNLSISYNSVSVILYKDFQQNPGYDCFSINNTLSIKSTMVAKDIEGNILNSGKDTSRIYISMPSAENKKFYTLYFSDLFNNYSLASSKYSNCLILGEANYTFGVFGFENSVLYENIQLLNQSYMRDYSNLRKDLGIEGDFEFIVYSSNRSILFNETIGLHKIKTSNVLSREIPIDTIDKNATKIKIILNLRAW